MLACDRIEPAGVAMGTTVHRGFPGLKAGEPVRPLSPPPLARARPGGGQLGVKRRPPRGPGRGEFLGRPGDDVVARIGFHRAVADPGYIAVNPAKAVDTDRPQIEGGRRLCHPFRQRHACAPRDAMPKALKLAPTNRFRSAGALPRMKVPSGVKLSGEFGSYQIFARSRTFPVPTHG